MSDSEHKCKRDISDSAKATLYRLKYEDAIADLKFAEAKTERLQSKIDYLNRCLAIVEPDNANTVAG